MVSAVAERPRLTIVEPTGKLAPIIDLELRIHEAEHKKRQALVAELVENPSAELGAVVIGGQDVYNPTSVTKDTPLQMLMVVDPGFMKNGSMAATFSSEKGFGTESVLKAEARATQFDYLAGQGEVDALRVTLDHPTAPLDVTLITQETFDQLLSLRNPNIPWGGGEVRVRTLDERPSVDTIEMRNFYGEKRVALPTTKPAPEGGAINTAPLMAVQGRRMYTGPLFNTMLPIAEVAYDRDGGSTSTLREFRDIMQQRVYYEHGQYTADSAHGMRQDTSAAIMNAHPQLGAFSPERRLQAQRMYPVRPGR